MTGFAYLVLGGGGLVLALNMIIVFNTGGMAKHNIHLYILFITSYYLVLAPTVTGITEDWVLFTLGWKGSVDIGDIYDFGMLMILLHFVFYTVGYLIIFRQQSFLKKDLSDISYRLSVGQFIEKRIFLLFLFLYMIIFFNTLAGGINLFRIFMGLYGEPTLGLRGYTYYMQNFADSLILLLVAGYYFKIKPTYYRIMLAMAIPLFLVLGFRYRIILFVFGFGIIYLRDNEVKLLTAIKAILFATLFVYSMLMLTNNRAEIYMQEWDKVNFSVSDLPYDALVNQAKGSRIDFALYKAIFENKIEHDYGKTTFLYPFIKLMPSFVFNGGEKPYPPPQIRDLHLALNSGSQVGEAITSVGSSFYSFGVYGVVSFSLLFGMLVGKLQNRYGKTMFSGLFSIAIGLSLFMWLTRGYSPGFIDHLGFMLIPILILNYFYNKAIRSAVKI